MAKNACQSNVLLTSNSRLGLKDFRDILMTLNDEVVHKELIDKSRMLHQVG